MIRLIEAYGYKCLKRIWTPLDNFQILVGPNASGKSTFLDVVGLLGDLVQEGLDKAIKKRAQNFSDLAWLGKRRWFALVIEVELPERLKNLMKLKHFGREYVRFRYEVVIGKEATGKVQIIDETLWLKPEDPATLTPQGQEDFNQLNLFENGTTLPKDYPHRQRTPPGWRKTVNKVSSSGKDYFISETTGWNAPFSLGPRKMALANVPAEEERFPVSSWARELLMEGIDILALNSEAMRRPCSPLSPDTFEPDGSNLPIVIKKLKREDPKQFKRWVKHLQTSLYDIQNVNVKERPEDKHLYIVITYTSGLKVPSWSISDGTLRMMALTLLAYLPEKERIFLVEEPENGIHPKAIETVFQSLSSAYDNQILVATHSPVILSVAKPDQVLCFRKGAEGDSRIIRGNQHPGLKGWRGKKNLGVLYASGVLD
ncbi:MAG: AAA family ATPase [Candidatus Bipolaricaulia bacterium]